MSLNWKEINLVLEELALENSHIQKIRQPDYHSLIFEQYKPGGRFTLYIGLKQGATRIHSLSRKIQGEKKLQRFAQFLRSRILGGRIIRACQLGAQRIVKLTVLRGGETTLLWVRLWGGAGNVIVTEESGTILDAFYRRPGRGEISGKEYNPEAVLDTTISQKDEAYEIRDLQGTGSFNERVERWYFQNETAATLSSLRRQAGAVLEKRKTALLITLERIRDKNETYQEIERYKYFGDLITSNIHTMKKGDTVLLTVDFLDSGAALEIELSPDRSPSENAEHYYRKYRKARRGLERLEKQKHETEMEMMELENTLSRIHESSDELFLRSVAGSGRKAGTTRKKHSPPGLSFTSGLFTILVGRTAKENDELLRNHVRGNDFWLHARDFPGAYVFIKHIPGKSIPLGTLLDAGNLALHYSRGKASGKGDLYYTQVKYLRRAKHGKTGTVLPTHEKNLAVRLDPSRIEKLLKAEQDLRSPV